jgi:hypothetical protein
MEGARSWTEREERERDRIRPVPAPPAMRSPSAAEVLRLQRSAGNAAVARLLARQGHPHSHPMNPPKRGGMFDEGGIFDEPGVLGDRPPKTMAELIRDPDFLAYIDSIQKQAEREAREADEELNLGPLLPAGMQLEEAAGLRKLYQAGAKAIAEEAQLMLSRGVPEAQVAEWATKARNALKQQIRDKGARIIKALAEARNMKKYGNPVGPSAEELRAKGKTNAQIIEGAERSNPRVNRWTGRMRVAGRIMIAIDIGIGIYNIANAAEVDRPRVLLRETGRIAGGLGGAAGGAKLGGMAFAWTGPVGAGIAAVVGGIGGAIIGSFLGSKAGDLVADQLYPPEQTGFEGDFATE